MSIFNNPNFISFSGEPITGRMPTKTVVYGPEMTGPQQAGVAHAYKLFCDAVNTSVSKYVVQNRVLADGTKVRMISNWGNDTVMVWPVGGTDAELTSSGIGICFTTHDGAPVEGWQYTDENADVWPQPIILRPQPKKVGGKITSSGKWRFEKVKKLLGGKQMWVDAERRNWFSSMVQYLEQQPAGTQTAIINARTKPDMQLYTVLDDWTATSNDRVYTNAPTGTTVAWEGKYIFANNDTVMLMPVTRQRPVFMTKLQLAGDVQPQKYLCVAREDNDGKGITIYRGRLNPQSGLAKQDAVPAASSYLSSEPVLMPVTQSDLYLIPRTLSIHPDGKRAMCMTYTKVGSTYTGYGKHVAITFSPTGEVTYVQGDPGVWTPGAYTPTGSLTATLAEEFMPRYSTLGSGQVVPRGQEVMAHASPLGRSEGTVTISGVVNTGKTSVWLNRHYYDRSGDEVLEKTTTVSSSSYGATGSHTRITDVGTDSFNVLPVVDTHEYTMTTSGVYSITETAELKGTSLALYSASTSMSQTLASTGTHQAGAPFDATMSGSTSTVQRDILFYDPINDFLIYLEVAATGEIAGTKRMPLGQTDVSSLVSGVVTAQLVGMFKGVSVDWLGYTIPLMPPVKSAYCEVIRDVKSMYGGYELIGFDLTTPFDVDLETTVASDSEEYQATETETATVTWNETTRVYSGPARDASDYIPQLSVYESERAKHFFQTDYAVDPVTLAVVVHLTFKGASMLGGLAEDKAWTIAVDATGARPIGDAIKGTTRIPDDIVLRQDAFINSLVSI